MSTDADTDPDPTPNAPPDDVDVDGDGDRDDDLDDTRPPPGQRDLCPDGEHPDWIETRTVPWDTRYPEKNRRWHTVVYQCPACGAKKWVRERRHASLKDFR